MPVVLVRWVTAITRVRGVTAFSMPATRSSADRAGTDTGTLLTTRASRRARSFQLSLFDGWLWSVMMTSSPGFRSIPRTIRLVPFAGVAGEGDLVGGDAEQRGHLGADRFPKRAVLVAILERRVGLEVAEQRGVPIQHGSRCGADVGRVQVDEPILERKLPPDELPERLLGAPASPRPGPFPRPERRRERHPARRQGGRSMQELASGRLHDSPLSSCPGTQHGPHRRFSLSAEGASA